MSVMPFLLAVGFIVASGFLMAFVWAVKSGQYDDTTTPAWRILWESGVISKRMRSDDETGKI